MQYAFDISHETKQSSYVMLY